MQFADCCATSKPFKFVFCDHCDNDLELARCSTCYAKFSSKLTRRLPEISSSMGAKPHLEPAVKALAPLRELGPGGPGDLPRKKRRL